MDRLPTLEEMQQSKDAADTVFYNAQLLADEVRDDASAIQKVAKPQLTSKSVGIYLHPDREKFAFDSAFFKLPAAQQVRLRDNVCGVIKQSRAELDTSDPLWIKVAYSPALRRAGELLNFFPGEYVKGIKNSPGPLQSMLASGLVGAGIGYGAGHLAERVLPSSWKSKKLKRNLAMLGGGLGVLPGAVWGGLNKADGRNFNDSSLLSKKVENIDPPSDVLQANDGIDLPVGDEFKAACDAYYDELVSAGDAFFKEAMGSFGTYGAETANDFNNSGFAMAEGVNVNAVGQVLWETGADPRETALTLGSLNAASRMPGGRKPGWVTPGQMGQLASRMGGGYLAGALVGGALSSLAGAPPSVQDQLKRTGAYMGVINTVVPRLFGT